jgi:hypothetical protein
MKAKTQRARNEFLFCVKVILSVYLLSKSFEFIILFFIILTIACVRVCTGRLTIFRLTSISDRHNEDGSYSYGFEAADGSYKIESKYPNGEVYGKYGFVDDSGTRREVEYGATRRGFEPVGAGINVPPPTLTGNSIAGNANEPEDDGQYREDPNIYHTDPRFTNGESYYNLSPKYRQPPLAYNPPQQVAPTASEQPKWVGMNFSSLDIAISKIFVFISNPSMNFKSISNHQYHLANHEYNYYIT